MKDPSIRILDHKGEDFRITKALWCFVGEPMSLKQIRFMSENANHQDTSMAVSMAQRFDTFCAKALQYDKKHK